MYLQDAMDEFDKCVDALDAAQSAVELELQDDKLERYLNEAADFSYHVRGPRIKATTIRASSSSATVSDASVNNDTNVSHSDH